MPVIDAIIPDTLDTDDAQEEEKTEFTFDELDQHAQERAIEQYREGHLDYDWWDCTYEDAANIGLKIEGFDCYRRTIDGKLDVTLEASCAAILKDHGNECNTYKLAVEYQKRLTVLQVTSRLTTDDADDYDSELDDAVTELTDEYRRELLELYLKSLDDEYEYLMSDEAIKESIAANDAMFTEDGELI